jgi:hypothetical protein
MVGIMMSTQAIADSPGDVGLCKGAIATIMYKDPSIMNGTMHGNEARIGYTRKADGSKFEMKCKFPKKGLIIWAGKIDGQWGRWRDHTADSIVTYDVGSDSTTFYENMASKIVGKKTFSNEKLE